MFARSTSQKPAAAATLAVTVLTAALAIGVLISDRPQGTGWACATAGCGAEPVSHRLPEATDVMQDWVAARSL